MTDKIKVLEKDIIQWRRHFHQYPELSFKEFETANYIESLLNSFGGIEVKRPTKTSVLATIRGNKKGRTVAFRADIDALPVSEETGLSFSSKHEGIMHACGHDAHTAMLLGTAKILSSIKDQINGTVKLIFQHAEERRQGGAREIIASGAIDDVDAIFGLHIMPNMKIGSMGFVKGATTTASDGFFLTIQGRGSHASMPQKAIDPILIGSELVIALNTIVSRNVPPGELAVLSLGKFQSGNMSNIIPDTAKLSGSIRTVSNEVRDILEKRVKEVIKHIIKANNASYDLRYVRDNSAVISDHELVDLAMEAVAKANGKDMVEMVEMTTASEDFSAYTEIKRGCYMFLGGGLAEDGYEYMNHHPKFIINESALAYGTRAEVQIILDYLNKIS